MKKFFFLAASILTLSLSVKAQSLDSTGAPKFDSSTVKLPITFKGKYHLDIIEAMKLSGVLIEPAYNNYFNQVMDQLDTTYAVAKEQSITVMVKSSLVLEAYKLLGVQQERIASDVNGEMRAALLPQVQSYSWLLREIIAVAANNEALKEMRRASAFQTIKATR